MHQPKSRFERQNRKNDRQNPRARSVDKALCSPRNTPFMERRNRLQGTVAYASRSDCVDRYTHLYNRYNRSRLHYYAFAYNNVLQLLAIALILLTLPELPTYI